MTLNSAGGTTYSPTGYPTVQYQQTKILAYIARFIELVKLQGRLKNQSGPAKNLSFCTFC